MATEDRKGLLDAVDELTKRRKRKGESAGDDDSLETGPDRAKGARTAKRRKDDDLDIDSIW